MRMTNEAVPLNVTPWDAISQSANYKFWLRGAQAAGTGAVVDESGNGAHGALNSLVDAACWANAGAFTTGTVAGHVVSVAIDKIAWDLAQDQSLILPFWINRANPASGGIAVLGCESTIPDVGFSIRSDVSGNLYLKLRNDTTTAAYATNPMAALDGTWHHCVVAIDGVSKTLYYYLDSVVTGAGIDISGFTASTLPNKILTIGAQSILTTPYAYQFRDVQMLVINGGLPSNLQTIINKLYSQPYMPVAASDL